MKKQLIWVFEWRKSVPQRTQDVIIRLYDVKTTSRRRFDVIMTLLLHHVPAGTLLVKLYVICSRMQRVNLHARPSIIQVGCPTCCYQVWALDHANGGVADLNYPSQPCHRNVLSTCATRNFAYLVRGPCNCDWSQCCQRFVKWWYYFATDQRLVVRHVTALWNVSPVLIP